MIILKKKGWALTSMVTVSVGVLMMFQNFTGTGNGYQTFTKSFTGAVANDYGAGADALWPATNAIDWNPGTSYSSNSFPSAMNSRGVIMELTGGARPVWQVVLAARMVSGVPLGFPPTYSIYYMNAQTQNWVDLGVFNAQPNSSGFAVVQLPEIYNTTSILVVPNSLGTDNYGSYYFQIADVTTADMVSPSLGIQPLVTAASNDGTATAKNAIDGNPASFYSSSYYTANYNKSEMPYLAVWSSSSQQISSVILSANMTSGKPQGFPVSYQISVTNPQNTAWINLGLFSAQPNSLGIVKIQLPQVYQTYGLLISAQTLGQDSQGHYVFELADIAVSNQVYPYFSKLNLNSNQSIAITDSETLSMQTDGNLVLYNNGVYLWATGTGGRSCNTGCEANFVNGVLSLTQNGAVYWSTNTSTTTGSTLVVTDQSPYLFIMNGGNSLWPSLPEGKFIPYQGVMNMILSSDGNLRIYVPEIFGNGGSWDTITSTELSPQSCNGHCLARFFPNGAVNLYNGNTLYYSGTGISQR